MYLQWIGITTFLFVSGTVTTYADSTLLPLNDEELALEAGQALLNVSYLAPSQAGNSNTDIGFYKLGLEGELQINANIKKLQLGCGGVNGAGNCDIDIDNLSLSGLGNSGSSNTANDADRNTRAGSSAVLTNPFIQFAIKNPNSASTREVVGVNLSSEKAIGLLTFGESNLKDAQNNGTPNGIKSLSGYMEIAAQGGKATVNPITITQNGATNPTNVALSGKACSGPYFGGCGASEPLIPQQAIR